MERALRKELRLLQARLDDLEATQKAIRSGDVDAIVVEGPSGTQVFTLQSPEDPYRILAERMNEGAATLTADGTILFCNRRLAEMVEQPSEQLVGSSFSELFGEPRQQRFSELLQDVLKGDIRTESDLLRRDGCLLAVQLSLSLVSFSESEQVICAVVTDLSELKRARQGLRDQAAVFEVAHDAIIMRGLDGQIQTWNRGAKDLYGWSAEEAQGKLSHELLQTEFPEPRESIVASLQARKEWEGELKHIRSDGKAIIVASRWSLLRDRENNPSAILEINRDITARKRAEEKLRSALLYSRSLIEASLDPLVTISREGKITDVNAATEKVTGICREGLIRTDFSDYFTESEKARQGYEQVFAEGAVRDYPLAIRSASGGITDVLYNASVFRNEAGEVEGVFAAARDVTERNRIEAARVLANESLRRLNQELEARVALRTAEISRVNEQLSASNKDLESFAYSVSHDLRAPLRHIDGFLALLSEQSYSTLDGKAKHYVDRTLEASRRMGSLIDDLLRFSRLGRSEIRKTRVDLNVLVAEAWGELEPETRNRKIALRVDRLSDVEGDRGMLRQVVENLMANALKFTRGRENVEIDIGCERGPKGDLVFHVRDNGVGFDMRYYNKLFQVFQRLHSESEFEGTGIGLALARRVVERHGGRIWAEGVVGAGATFLFSLPDECTKGEADELAQAYLAG